MGSASTVAAARTARRTQTGSGRIAAALALATAFAALTPNAGAAQSTQELRGPHEPPAEAVEFYRRGRELYQQGRYAEAAVELERALMLDPTSPNLVFNVARVYELLGEIDKAIAFYQRYLRLLPEEDTDERERIQSTLRRLAGARDTLARRRPPSPETAGQLRDPQPIRVRERGVADAAFWVTAGIGAALLVGGAVVGILALGAEGQVRDFVLGADGTEEDRLRLADRADTLALAADASFALGAAVSVAAILLFALRERTVERYPGLRSATRGGRTVVGSARSTGGAAGIAPVPGGAALLFRSTL
jgi:tetratricopeptide (TPR) repeat protein